MYTSNDTTTEMTDLTTMHTYQIPHEMHGFTGACALIIAILGAIANLFTIVALPMNRKLRTTSTAYIVNLSVVQLLYCVVVLPVVGANEIYKQYHEEGFLYNIGCQIVAVTNHSIGQVQLQIILAVAVTRAIAIGCPHFYRKIDNRYVTAAYITFIWIYSFVIKFVRYDSYQYNDNTLRCESLTDKKSKIQRKVNHYKEITLPIVIITLLYIYIFIKVKMSSLRVQKMALKSKEQLSASISQDPSGTTNNGRKLSNSSIQSLTQFVSQSASNVRRRSSNVSQRLVLSNRDTKVAKIIFVIFIIMILCMMPISVAHSMLTDGRLPRLFLAARILYWLTNFLNIIVYVLMNNQYRDAYIELVAKIRPSFGRHVGYTFPWEDKNTEVDEITSRKNSISSSENSSLKDSQDTKSATPQYGRHSEVVQMNKDSELDTDSKVRNSSPTENSPLPSKRYGDEESTGEEIKSLVNENSHDI